MRAAVDGFPRPRAQRRRLGRHSPHGFFHDSYDYPALQALLLDPLGPHDDGRYRRAVRDVGTFARMARRDGCPPDPDHPANRRYRDGQLLYLAACDPARRADVVVDNDDPDDPRPA